MDTPYYTSVIVDAAVSDFLKAAVKCVVPGSNRKAAIQSLKQSWNHPLNPNHVLPCLSVRTGFDLYLKIMAFPPGSEVIMSAINIPDMSLIVKAHGLNIVPLDISLLTVTPKIENLEHLITEKTRLIVLAHIYGRRYDLSPFIAVAHKYKLPVIEDCAEIFTGLEYTGHPQADLSMFSFGTIKNCTSFGGSIVKVRDDKLYQSMLALYNKYPVQPRLEYLQKVLRYFPVYLILTKPRVNFICRWVCYKFFNMDALAQSDFTVKLMRGFPTGMMEKIRHQASTPLLQTMAEKHKDFHPDQLILPTVKGDYVAKHLPPGMELVGSKSECDNYWLFPVLVENPDEMVRYLITRGVNAYRGATQLNVVDSTTKDNNISKQQNFTLNHPHNAEYLIDHVIYLPVSKLVPFDKLRKICDILKSASEELAVGVDCKTEQRMLDQLNSPKLKFKSKL